MRLIPAHAGKTSTSFRATLRVMAHPRSRGENTYRRTGSRLMPGSSPLTRGKRRVHREAASLRRLIPAHAGKTQPPNPGSAVDPAHPRSRGENSPHTRVRMAFPGSSPLTRGKRQITVLSGGDLGLIPAHAGKTRASRMDWPPAPAHPRSRGENSDRQAGCCPGAGSSPLTRGKPTTQFAWMVGGRLIPAHAGKTD